MKKIALGVIIGVTALALLFMGDVVSAADAACNQPELQDSSFCQGTTDNFRDFAASITNMLLFLIGTAAVVVIIIGGIKYATADGDPGKITSAKNNILYSVIGLIVAIMAWGIVSFVVNRASAGNAGQSSASSTGTTPTNNGTQQGAGGTPSAPSGTTFRHCVTADRQFCVQERGVADAQACQTLAVQRAGSNASSFYENGTCFRDRDP